MDGSHEHSDSDSGESWTLLEHTPAYVDEVPDIPEIIPENRDLFETNTEKDEDTDGISIISDSEPESPMPCESFHNRYLEHCHTEDGNPQIISINKPMEESILHESLNNDNNFLGDNNGKLKTYVHKRNKRLSTVLNIIVLGSVITAAGVAIGHMWGAKNECTVNNAPSVNKILSNLYKLQEENAFLRNKLKELTLMNSINMQQRKSGTDISLKQNKCRKVFEESLNNKNTDKPTKCVDNDYVSKLLDMHSTETKHEKEFLRDIDKLKNVYKQNKSWLDDEVSKRLNFEEHSIKRLKQDLKRKIKENEAQIPLKGDSLDRHLETINEIPNKESPTNVPDSPNRQDLQYFPEQEKKPLTERKISYADSLKSEQKPNIHKREIKVSSEMKTIQPKKKNSKELDAVSGHSISEHEFIKDDRYVGHKHKQDRKKHDRQKLHKKQKRKNKYEQWEMKGGYLKDYDDFSISSSQENEYVLKNPDKNILAKDFERDNYISQFSENDNNLKVGEVKAGEDEKNVVKNDKKDKHGKSNGKKKEKDMNWFEKRAVFRNEARKKLEHELFGETSPNNAGWYFRRMQRREQCRSKSDNSTYRKLSKRNMNFKSKH